MVERRLLSQGYGAVATAAKNTVTKGTDGAYGSMSRIAHKNQPPWLLPYGGKEATQSSIAHKN